MADRPNTAVHLIDAFAASEAHTVTQRWIALAPEGEGVFDLPATVTVMTERTPKFVLLQRLLDDAAAFDWIILSDDDAEVGPGFLDNFLNLATRYDFALAQPARTTDSFTDHPIVQVIPGMNARLTRFVEIGPLVAIRRDAAPILLPFGHCGMGWGLDFVWPVRLEAAGLRLGIVDGAPAAHRLRPPVMSYSHRDAHREMADLLARERHLTLDEAFRILEIYT
jgi:hypothetical protein